MPTHATPAPGWRGQTPSAPAPKISTRPAVAGSVASPGPAPNVTASAPGTVWQSLASRAAPPHFPSWRGVPIG
ncbi:hypothetical protein BLA29_000038 [Euroglyphus maynei]|uniref:Uncharacterized protein n=1 Tax=Euroglyphus maynei TaxID=6958 RepID=A0A1Y3AQ41_EURMA|nr:hypothetical protein BLA29_000038 [Euroglyphus maynei]